MKKIGLIFGVMSSLLLISCVGDSKETNKSANSSIELKSSADSISYAIGYIVGSQFKQDLIEVENYDAFKNGMNKAISSDTALAIKKDELQKIARAYFMEFPKRAEKKEKEWLKNNKANNSKIVELENGIQYEIIKEGKGEIVTSDTVPLKVHYVGSLVTGEEFDNSYKRKEPAVFSANQVIKGWGEILKIMPIGSKWVVYIPYELGYGLQGSKGAIPPCATLKFEIELVDKANKE